MAQPLLVTATLLAANGLVEDDVVMGFPINAADTFDVDLELGELTTPINAMYNVAPNIEGNKVSQYISTEVSRASGSIQYRVYDLAGHLDGSPHGSPIATDVGTLGPASGGQPLPSEVAFVCTTRASGWAEVPVAIPLPPPGPAGDIRTRQRYSGRLFFGPLMVGALNATAPQRPQVLFRNVVRDAVTKLCQDLMVNGHALCVWSRKDAAMRPVTHVQTDDAFDTQRRRGIAPSSRVTNSVV